MITEHIAYSLKCDFEGCDEVFDGEEDRPKWKVTDDAEEEGWTVHDSFGSRDLCPEHSDKGEMKQCI